MAQKVKKWSLWKSGKVSCRVGTPPKRTTTPAKLLKGLKRTTRRPSDRSIVAGLLAAIRTRRFGLDNAPSNRWLDCSTRGRTHSRGPVVGEALALARLLIRGVKGAGGHLVERPLRHPVADRIIGPGVE